MVIDPYGVLDLVSEKTPNTTSVFYRTLDLMNRWNIPAELELEVVMDRLSARGGWGQGTATVGGKVACKARLFFIVAPAGGANGAR